MTDHPITPPPELVQQWDDEGTFLFRPEYQMHIATRAAQWGSNQELEACCEVLHQHDRAYLLPSQLRAARRPKPPSLKEQALTALERYMTGETILTKDSLDTIRRALEELP